MRLNSDREEPRGSESPKGKRDGGGAFQAEGSTGTVVTLRQSDS